jgi:hypothetical protein
MTIDQKADVEDFSAFVEKETGLTRAEAERLDRDDPAFEAYRQKRMEYAKADRPGRHDPETWDFLRDRFYELTDEILSHRAATREGLALQARALISSYSEIWEHEHDDDGVLDFIQSVCAFSGVPFPPYGEDAPAVAAGPSVATEAGAAQARQDADPILAVIAEHRAAQEALHAAGNVPNAEYDQSKWEQADDRAIAAELPLFTTAPTTIAGVAALLEYVGADAQPHLQGDEERVSTVLSYAHG